jgi:hypothetical protein
MNMKELRREPGDSRGLKKGRRGKSLEESQEIAEA